jgi:RHS repeat-associated protein
LKLEMTRRGSGLAARYDYDPWGRRVNVIGSSFDADFGFTGHYYHASSGLHLAHYRAYSAELGRWLCRDPLENAELLPDGSNVYGYVGNRPSYMVDPLGLKDCPPGKTSKLNWDRFWGCMMKAMFPLPFPIVCPIAGVACGGTKNPTVCLVALLTCVGTTIAVLDCKEKSTECVSDCPSGEKS